MKKEILLQLYGAGFILGLILVSIIFFSIIEQLDFFSYGLGVIVMFLSFIAWYYLQITYIHKKDGKQQTKK